eukprot:TRINITY_DN11244_c0_g1_i1.p1 TRINITY_DN11244_c0_g1~~TRINITY_DN11244_c0_g1_i1.p1  ORF type:complete len:395 (+),score=124.10 TRINITY_DN11244_c0_g1_i1:45-1229(+)
MNKVMDGISGAVSGAAGAVGGAMSAIGSSIKSFADDTETEKNCKEAEKKYEEYYKSVAGESKSIEVKVDKGSDWDSRVQDFMKKAAPASFADKWTLQFLRDEDKRKVWNKGCDKVILTYAKAPSEDELEHIDEYSWARVSREDSTVYIKFYERCLGYTTIYLRDEIEFGLNMDQLTGKCYYKSGWVDKFSEPKFPFGTDSVKRWLQCRHYCVYWYPRRMWGWNWKASEPPEGEDSSLFDKLPGLPDIKLPKLPNLPSLSMPDLSMPDLSMPDISMPDVSMPDLSAPDLSMPSLSAPDLSAPDLPEAKKRPQHRWAPHGRIQLDGAKVCNKGKTLIISGATVLQFWENRSGGYEEEKNKRIEVECDDKEQAESWVATLEYGGATVGEVSGCCSIM